MICPFHTELHAKRRSALLDALAAKGPDGVAIFPAAPVHVRNNDVDHDYRQDSDLYYLTGFDEPHSVLVLSARDRKATLFVRPRDPERETWDGPRAGVEGAKTKFGADDAFTIAELATELPRLFSNQRRLYYRLGRDRSFDDKVLEAIDRTRVRGRTGVGWPTEILDPVQIVHEMRLY